MQSVPGAVATGSPLDLRVYRQMVTRSLPLPVLTSSQIKTLAFFSGSDQRLVRSRVYNRASNALPFDF
jgi:hypothetical protein